MNRRRLLVTFGAVALAVPFTVLGQQKERVWRVGYLAQRHIEPLDTFGAFTSGMRDLGYVEGRNLVIELRSAEGDFDRLAALAAELVRLKPDVIVAGGSVATAELQKATTRIPIVMGAVGDPVGAGFVKSLARPGGNITGLSNVTPDYGAKFVEMLREAVPGLSRLAYLLNPANPSQRIVAKNAEAASKKAGIAFILVEARSAREIEGAFAVVRQRKAGAIIVGGDALLTQERSHIAALAIRNRLPSIGQFTPYVEAGGLMCYGPSQIDSFRRAASYVDKILKGANPGDLPVEQATMFELFINRKTAKALGITIPHELLLRADKVIE